MLIPGTSPQLTRCEECGVFSVLNRPTLHSMDCTIGELEGWWEDFKFWLAEQIEEAEFIEAVYA